MLSFWEKQSLLGTDIAIVGGGITGLSVACSIKERHPELDVTVFERSVLPFGASTRNAGFACFGSLTEIASDIRLMGTDLARELVFKRWMGLQITRKRLGDAKIGFEQAGGFELCDVQQLEQMDVINEMLVDFLPHYISSADQLKISLGIHQEGRLVQMHGEGQVNTGLLLRNLERCANALGVVMRTGCHVRDIQSRPDVAIIEIEDFQRGPVRFISQQAVVCTNAFVKNLLPQMDVVPGRGQVLLTYPIKNLAFKGNLHFDEGYYYLRNVGNRLLFGGGRNLDFKTEESHEFELNGQIQEHLTLELMRIFGMATPFEVDMRWAGIMAFGADKLPIVKVVDQNIIAAVRMSGMGIALAGYIGEEVADLL